MRDNTLFSGSQQQLLPSLLKYCPAIVAMVDQEMRYLAVTDTWKTQFDLGSTNIEGKNHYDLSPNTPLIWKERHQRCLKGETISMEEDSMVGSNGRV